MLKISTLFSLFFISSTMISCGLSTNTSNVKSGDAKLSEKLSSLQAGVDYVEGEFLVSLKQDSNLRSTTINAVLANNGVKLKQKVDKSTFLVESELYNVLDLGSEFASASIEVKSIEPNYIAHTTEIDSATSWGLDRIDGYMDGKYAYQETGKDVHVYVVDSGVYAAHQDFENRVKDGWSAFAGDPNTDCEGHGTHVAGTIAGKSFGVAKEATIHSVRVLSCGGSGSYSDIIAGLQWIKNHVRDNQFKSAVVNMSLAGPKSSQFNEAVEQLIAEGINVVVAAGNESSDACSKSPASAPNALTVGATTSSDALASYSNYGSCVDILAPGSDIISASSTSDTGSTVKNGTSMASPHVAGVVALKLSTNPEASPKDIENTIKNDSMKDQIKGLNPNTVNFLVTSQTSAPLKAVKTYPKDKKTNVKVHSQAHAVAIDFNKRIAKGAEFGSIEVFEMDSDSSKVGLNLEFEIKAYQLKSSGYMWQEGKTYLFIVPANAIKAISGETYAQQFSFTWTMETKSSNSQ